MDRTKRALLTLRHTATLTQEGEGPDCYRRTATTVRENGEVWLISRATGGPWFLWLVIPAGFILLRRWLLAEERQIRNH